MNRLLALFALLLCVGGITLKDTQARAILRRDAGEDLANTVNELEAPMTPEEKELFEHDVQELEHAIEDEIVHKEPEIQSGHLKEVSPAKLDKEVTEHNEKKPWYVRLGRFLKQSLHDFVQHTAKKVINNIVIPAITNQIFGTK